MRVKVNDTWYDSTVEAICVQLNEGEQQQVADLDRSVCVEGKYCQYPVDKYTEDEIAVWMAG